ncbi:MAG: LytTR family DNA-binding domain-containing protein [Chryseolinea sp.]
MMRADQKIIKPDYDSIVFLEGWSEHVIIHCIDRTYVTLNSLKTVLDELPGDQFLRVHKSFIVSLRKVFPIHTLSLISRKRL